MDSTRAALPLRRLRRAVLAGLAVVIAAGSAGVPGALADGDPASDVLATQALFLPQDAAIPSAEQDQLTVLLREARASGEQIRVAVIASPTDLGSVGELWRQPQNYARFLGAELSLVYRGRLLVVMPDGFGLAGPARGERADRAALAAAPAPAAGLGPAAVAAVRRLGAADGHSLALPRASGARTGSSSGELARWVVLILGAGLIAAAWTASLRRRPLGGTGTLPPSAGVPQ